MPMTACCPKCGLPVDTTVLGGLCPACVQRVALAEPDAPDSEAGPVKPGDWTPPTVAELTALLPPGTYAVESLVGRGGMGAVYRARQLRLDRVVAIKVMRHDHRAGLEFIERFRREALTLASLNHPNIVSVIDSGEAGPELLYLVMEFVDGADLLQVIRSGGMTQERALEIIPQICDALQFAHDHGVVHRDIKPSNLLITREGRVKIADFGLAKPFDHDTGPQTRTGVGLGTPEYAAPEQFQPGAAVDHRADIYALGVMMYQMLTGQLPRGAWAPPSKTASVDTRWDAIVNQALQAKPDDRYRTATEVKSDVTAIARTPSTARPRWLVPAYAVLALVLAGAWYAQYKPPAATTAAPATTNPIATAAPSAVTPLGYGQPLLFRGHRYELVDGQLTWEQARVEAERRGGHLATLTSREENEAVAKAFAWALDDADTFFWVGGVRSQGGSAWRWVTGEPFEFSDWNVAQPDAASFPAYLQVWQPGKDLAIRWDDTPYVQTHTLHWRGYLIEWDTTNAPPPKTGSHVTATLATPFTNSLGMKFVPVTATAAGHPVHFSVWETRNRDYALFAAGRTNVNLEWKTTAGLPTGPDHPVVMMNWTDAVAFCHWLTDHERARGSIGPWDTYRLPSDREWSAAVGLTDETGATPFARHLKSPGFPWGSDWPPPEGAGNFADTSSRELPPDHPVLKLPYVREQLAARSIPGYRDGFASTAPVGSFPPDALGLHDLSGNALEWCSDRFQRNLGDPTRVHRGGSWTDGTNDKGALRSSHRNDGMPLRRYAFRGFRVVLEVVR